MTNEAASPATGVTRASLPAAPRRGEPGRSRLRPDLLFSGILEEDLFLSGLRP